MPTKPPCNRRRRLVGPPEFRAGQRAAFRRTSFWRALRQHTGVAQPFDDTREDRRVLRNVLNESQCRVVLGLQDSGARRPRSVAPGRNAQQLQPAVRRHAVYGGFNLFLVDVATAPEERPAPPSLDQLDRWLARTLNRFGNWFGSRATAIC